MAEVTIGVEVTIDGDHHGAEIMGFVTSRHRNSSHGLFGLVRKRTMTYDVTQ
jgi:hypothetical protein